RRARKGDPNDSHSRRVGRPSRPADACEYRADPASNAMSAGGTTRLAHPAALPLGPDNATLPQGENVVKFVSEDARSRIFDVSTLPLPGWHPSLMKSWSLRIGVSGSLRTLSSVTGAWGTLVRFIRFLAQTPRVPKTPSDLQV